MADNWSRYCRSPDLIPNGTNTIDVTFSDGRRHRIYVADQADVYQLHGFVVRRGRVEALEDLPTQAWLRNRSTALVGFRIDDRSRLLGEAWVPKAGLTAEEFELYVRNLAAECDRFEFVLTGRDAE